MAEIFRKTSVDIPEREVYRYLGYGNAAPDEHVMAVARECMEEINDLADYRACRVRVPVSMTEDGVLAGNILLPGNALARNLAGCREIFAFAATCGPKIDRRISVLQYGSPSKALVMDAAASAAIEAFCDALNSEWEDGACTAGEYLRSRFSPGYGDLPLSVQGDFLRLLDAPHLIGLTLTESLIMIPRKSVTAVIGISDQPADKARKKCVACGKKDCPYRA